MGPEPEPHGRASRHLGESPPEPTLRAIRLFKKLEFNIHLQHTVIMLIVNF